MTLSGYLRVAVLSVICVATAAGCAGTPASDDGAGATFEQTITHVLERAEAGGAGDAQLALLAHARDSEELGIEAVREAARAFAGCAADAGIAVEYREHVREDGWIAPGYAVDVAEGQEAKADEVVERCELQELAWVSMAYQSQPVAMDATTAYLDAQAPVLRACLLQAGASPDPEASGRELAQYAIDGAVDPAAGSNCLHEAGIDYF